MSKAAKVRRFERVGIPSRDGNAIKMLVKHQVERLMPPASRPTPAPVKEVR